MEENGVDALKKALDRVISQKGVGIEAARQILIEVLNKNREIRRKVGENLYLEILDKEYEILRDCLRMLGEETKSNEAQPVGKRVVRIGVVNSEIPRFIGKGDIELGPFKKGDIISVNEYDMNLLKKSNYLNIVDEEI